MVGFIAERLAVQSAFIERHLSARPAAAGGPPWEQAPRWSLARRKFRRECCGVDHLERGREGSVGRGSSRAGCSDKGSADPRGSSEAGMALQSYSRRRQWGQALYSLTDRSLDAAAPGTGCGIKGGRSLRLRAISGDSWQHYLELGTLVFKDNLGAAARRPPHGAKHILCL